MRERLRETFARLEDAIGSYCEARNQRETWEHLQPNAERAAEAHAAFVRSLGEMMRLRDELRLMLSVENDTLSDALAHAIRTVVDVWAERQQRRMHYIEEVRRNTELLVNAFFRRVTR